VTDDLKIAKIYISFMENRKTSNDLMKVLIDKRNLIRYYVGMELKLKYIPKLRFYHDDTMEHAENIDKLINKIHYND
jgi:ribosome-binding factor A